MHLSDRLTNYLKAWYTTSTTKQRSAGNEVTLTFPEFLELLGPKRAKSLQKSMDENLLRSRQDVQNKFAFVLTWKSYAACSSGVMCKDTATICTRQQSAALNLPAKGDKLRPGHRANLSKKLSGRTLSNEHKENISKARKAQPGRQWTDEQRAAASERARAREAAKKGSSSAARA